MVPLDPWLLKGSKRGRTLDLKAAFMRSQLAIWKSGTDRGVYGFVGELDVDGYGIVVTNAWDGFKERKSVGV